MLWPSQLRMVISPTFPESDMAEWCTWETCLSTCNGIYHAMTKRTPCHAQMNAEATGLSGMHIAGSLKPVKSYMTQEDHD